MCVWGVDLLLAIGPLCLHAKGIVKISSMNLNLINEKNVFLLSFSILGCAKATKKHFIERTDICFRIYRLLYIMTKCLLGHFSGKGLHFKIHVVYCFSAKTGIVNPLVSFFQCSLKANDTTVAIVFKSKGKAVLCM